MNTKILILLSLLLYSIAEAQIVNIPDAAFKNLLLSANAGNDIARDLDNDPAAIDLNSDNEIQVSEALNISRLDVSAAGIYNLSGIEAFINLDHLECAQNYLTALPVQMLTNLEELDCSENNISAINLTGLINITELSCGGNPFTVIDVSEQVNLEVIDCNSTAISQLDLSFSPFLISFNISDCTALEYLNIKNGTILISPELTDISNTPSLSFICVDEDEADVLSLYFPVYMSTYCSFIPGGDYNTITGTLTFDADNNGCDPSDPVQQFIKLNINDGTNEGSTFTNTAGSYNFYTQAGSFTVMPQFEDNYFTAAPVSANVNFPVVDNSVNTQNFCITANGVHPDIEVVMVPVVPAQPGFDAVYKIVYKNKGNTTLSGTIGCQWDPQYFELIDLIPMADYTMQGNYGWDFINLQPFENREITMVLNVNAPTDTPAVNIDDVLQFTANTTVADETPQDNTFILNQVVVGAFDPNNIMCIEGESAPPEMIGEYLHYVVNFENTGTAAATNIVVRHEINPAQFDISTLELLNSSHEVEARVLGDNIEFIFKNANLQAAGHGNILFKVKSRTSLMENDMVTNSANIYFDYNYPVLTNNANTVFETLSRNDQPDGVSVSMYPNPAKDNVILTAEMPIASVQLYDVQGRLLQVQTANETTFSLNLTGKQAGVYFIKVSTAKGSRTLKLIKE